MRTLVTGGTGFTGSHLVRRLLARGERLTELLKQPQYSPMSVEDQVIAIFSGVRGHLDAIEVNQINRFESQLLEHIRSSHPEIINAIKETGDLDESTDAKLDQAVSDFVKTFA